MSYASELEARIAKKVTRAVVEYGLIEDGDRVMVGLSGGKDSWTLIQVLDVMRARAPIRFSLVAVNVDSGYEGYREDLVAAACADRGWEYRRVKTSIGAVIEDKLEDGATPCPLCARLRRGVLYRVAGEVGATKIALGHHLDDFIETLLLNLFFEGCLKAMPAKLVSDDGAHVVIRPLVYVGEAEARQYTKERGLPIVFPVPVPPLIKMFWRLRTFSRRRLANSESSDPMPIKSSMVKALANVAPRHLLDTRLNPPAALRARAAALEAADRK